MLGAIRQRSTEEKFHYFLRSILLSTDLPWYPFIMNTLNAPIYFLKYHHIILYYSTRSLLQDADLIKNKGKGLSTRTKHE